MNADKRDECGCHRSCTTLPHECDVPCRWPSCLTEDEANEVALCARLERVFGGPRPANEARA